MFRWGHNSKSFKRLAIISSMKNQDQISPLDNRYNQKIVELAKNFSESNLNKTRFEIEIDWIIFLTTQCGKKFPPLSNAAKKNLLVIKNNFNEKSTKRIKKIESKTNHDVKAVEYFIREKLAKMNKKRVFPWIHFALTSEDINNLSYSLMWQDAFKNEFLPTLNNVIKKLKTISKQFSDTSMLSLTHGQSATPTTFGKEIYVFVHRLNRQYNTMKNAREYDEHCNRI